MKKVKLILICLLALTLTCLISPKKIKADELVVIENNSIGYLLSNVDDPISLTEIRSYLFSFDNLDGDLSSSIIMISDGYSAHKNTVGMYDIVFSSSDSAGNTSSITIKVVVVDITSPIILGDRCYLKTVSSVLTEDTIKSNLRIGDNVDSQLSDKIEKIADTYTGNADKIGLYSISYRVTDLSSNVSDDFIIEIKVIDSNFNFWLTESALNTYVSNQMSHADIFNFLSSASLIPDNVISYQFLSDTYSDSYDQPGLYSISLKLIMNDESITYLVYSINVIDDSNVLEVDAKPLTFFQKIGMFFEKLINWISGKGWVLDKDVIYS